MNNYVSLVKGWYNSGHEMINSYSDSKKKASFVKI